MEFSFNKDHQVLRIKDSTYILLELHTLKLNLTVCEFVKESNAIANNINKQINKGIVKQNLLGPWVI